ncbi:hypothetical protein MPS_4369 [Mycobacterium pseudoshottsii JCM 15466]|uniref:Uncharacterized protein n=1 Tax=Mycobacterium ulcerans str. Harvey TaxID=1299332 RepID=A0ABN0QW22_MYCUL|nr:hypothetical protein I551_4563 [Mycobacterium ulcerans str. Harvey]GAQ38754.1 hypothetical protein MPS_4369 [Mycobacterium pseudoshottsii JCM 15466]
MHSVTARRPVCGSPAGELSRVLDELGDDPIATVFTLRTIPS